MKRPSASVQSITQLRALVDDGGFRPYLVDIIGLDKSVVSRILRAIRDEESIEPRVGLVETIIRRARQALDADGHRAGVEALLSSLAGEPVRLGLPEPSPPPAPAGAPARPASPAEVVARVCALSGEAGGLAAQLARDAADGALDEREVERAMQGAAAVHEHLRLALQALREQEQRR